MDHKRRLSYICRRMIPCLGAALFLLACFAVRLQADDYQNLPVVKPIITCEQLGKTDLGAVVGAKAEIKSATVIDTPKGQYCAIKGTIEPMMGFQVYLPLEHWMQRFVEGAMGNAGISNAGGCSPALNGEFVTAAQGMGQQGPPPNQQPGAQQGGPQGGPQANPNAGRDNPESTSLEGRINYAYRANHNAALIAKTLIKAFYGQPQKYSYFMGCSEGGRQALTEAERYPDDFDGITAGAPVAIDSVHNVFYHPWEFHANTKDANGNRILAADRLSILHDAVITHCAAVSGLIDGMLQEPTACKFDPRWVQCANGTTDTSKCLTAAEVGVVEKLYEGPSDGKGNFFEIAGFPLGSENFWKLSVGDQYANRETLEGFAMRRLLPTPESLEPATQLEAEFQYNQAWYEKTMPLAPLFNAANTNLKPFADHGSKLILWHGAEDLTVQPAVSVAFYEGVQKQLGANTDGTIRFFLLPGVGHCSGGEGPNQIDLLSAIMAWVEMQHAPEKIIAGKTAATGGPGGGMGGPARPFATPAQPTLFTRPIYPFPFVAKYSGKGDVNDAANYVPVKSSIPVPQIFATQAAKLFGPDNQKFFHVEHGQLVPDNK